MSICPTDYLLLLFLTKSNTFFFISVSEINSNQLKHKLQTNVTRLIKLKTSQIPKSVNPHEKNTQNQWTTYRHAAKSE